MRYAIQINGRPGPLTATGIGYQFTKAALKEGHRVLRVFFYQDGIYQAYPPPGGDPGTGPDWSRLALEQDLDLVLCATAVERRGLSGTTAPPGFRHGGLGQWMEACLSSDRRIVFAD